MLDSSLSDIEGRLRDRDLVLDVGGWGRPLVRADWVLDILPYETRAPYGYQGGDREDARFSEHTWIRHDICGRDPWPFEDDQFDFAICSHTLEDLRDPIWVCSELTRVSRAGYIEVPSRVEELTWGIHGPWVGWAHHRWLVDVRPGEIEFVFKTHALNGNENFHFPQGFCDALPSEHRAQVLWWEGRFDASELLLIGAEAHDAYILEFVGEQLKRRPYRPPEPNRERRWRHRLRVLRG